MKKLWSLIGVTILWTVSYECFKVLDSQFDWLPSSNYMKVGIYTTNKFNPENLDLLNAVLARYESYLVGSVYMKELYHFAVCGPKKYITPVKDVISEINDNPSQLSEHFVYTNMWKFKEEGYEEVQLKLLKKWATGRSKEMGTFTLSPMFEFKAGQRMAFNIPELFERNDLPFQTTKIEPFTIAFTSRHLLSVFDLSRLVSVCEATLAFSGIQELQQANVYWIHALGGGYKLVIFNVDSQYQYEITSYLSNILLTPLTPRKASTKMDAFIYYDMDQDEESVHSQDTQVGDEVSDQEDDPQILDQAETVQSISDYLNIENGLARSLSVLPLAFTDGPAHTKRLRSGIIVTEEGHINFHIGYLTKRSLGRHAVRPLLIPHHFADSYGDQVLELCLILSNAAAIKMLNPLFNDAKFWDIIQNMFNITGGQANPIKGKIIQFLDYFVKSHEETTEHAAWMKAEGTISFKMMAFIVYAILEQPYSHRLPESMMSHLEPDTTLITDVLELMNNIWGTHPVSELKGNVSLDEIVTHLFPFGSINNRAKVFNVIPSIGSIISYYNVGVPVTMNVDVPIGRDHAAEPSQYITPPSYIINAVTRTFGGIVVEHTLDVSKNNFGLTYLYYESFHGIDLTVINALLGDFANSDEELSWFPHLEFTIQQTIGLPKNKESLKKGILHLVKIYAELLPLLPWLLSGPVVPPQIQVEVDHMTLYVHDSIYDPKRMNEKVIPWNRVPELSKEFTPIVVELEDEFDMNKSVKDYSKKLHHFVLCIQSLEAYHELENLNNAVLTWAPRYELTTLQGFDLILMGKFTTKESETLGEELRKLCKGPCNPFKHHVARDVIVISPDNFQALFTTFYLKHIFKESPAAINGKLPCDRLPVCKRASGADKEILCEDATSNQDFNRRAQLVTKHFVLFKLSLEEFYDINEQCYELINGFVEGKMESDSFFDIVLEPAIQLSIKHKLGVNWIIETDAQLKKLFEVMIENFDAVKFAVRKAKLLTYMPTFLIYKRMVVSHKSDTTIKEYFLDQLFKLVRLEGWESPQWQRVCVSDGNTYASAAYPESHFFKSAERMFPVYDIEPFHSNQIGVLMSESEYTLTVKATDKDTKSRLEQVLQSFAISGSKTVSWFPDLITKTKYKMFLDKSKDFRAAQLFLLHKWSQLRHDEMIIEFPPQLSLTSNNDLTLEVAEQTWEDYYQCITFEKFEEDYPFDHDIFPTNIVTRDEANNLVMRLKASLAASGRDGLNVAAARFYWIHESLKYSNTKSIVVHYPLLSHNDRIRKIVNLMIENWRTGYSGQEYHIKDIPSEEVAVRLASQDMSYLWCWYQTAIPWPFINKNHCTLSPTFNLNFDGEIYTLIMTTPFPTVDDGDPRVYTYDEIVDSLERLRTVEDIFKDSFHESMGDFITHEEGALSHIIKVNLLDDVVGFPSKSFNSKSRSKYVPYWEMQLQRLKAGVEVLPNWKIGLLPHISHHIFITTELAVTTSDLEEFTSEIDEPDKGPALVWAFEDIDDGIGVREKLKSFSKI